MARDQQKQRIRLSDLPLGIKGILVVAVPVCALLLAMVVFYRFETGLRVAESDLDRTFMARSELRRLLIDMINAETGVRGYLLTGKREFLEPYERARKELPKTLVELRKTAPAEQKAQLNEVESLADRILQALEESRRIVPMKPEQELPYLERDRSAMEELRQTLDRIQSDEQAALERRAATAARAERRLRWAFFGGGVLGLMGGILGALLFSHSIGNRLRVLQQEARDVATGRRITSRLSGRDEVSQLERTLVGASEQLARQSEELRQAQSELEARVVERTAELEKANEELREANEVREAVVHSSPLAIWALDLDGTVRFWNPAAEAIFGWKAEEVVGKPLPVIPEELRGEYAEWLEGFRRGEMISGKERPRLRKDGSRVDMAIWTAPLRDGSGRIVGTITIDSDVSQRKLLEEQFRQAQKLEAVGRLAGGVAHDFNNLLTIIQGYTEMVLMEAEHLPSMTEYAREIEYAAERASALTSQLLAFSRRQISQPQPLDLNQVVSHSLKMLRRIIGEDIEITTRLAPDLGKVMIDPVHIDQVIMNLAVNARDAMPQGGRLAIDTANVWLDADYTGRHIGVAPGAYCLLAVSDTGVGMNAETRSRLFEPFFTTKEAGKGTGLGLAIVYGIVKQAGGDILVYSEPGQGTTFKIYLPRAEPPTEKVAAGPGGAVRGNETILICEDDPKIRALVQAMLTRQGYRVLAAQQPAEAVEMLRKLNGPLDLLLTDVVMPGTSGLELAKTVAEMRPEARILYMSGYTDHQMGAACHLEQDMSFIQKPFTSAALAAKVREVLGSSR